MRLIDADAFEQDLKEKLLPLLMEKYGKEEAMKGLHFSLQDCISNIQGQPTITQPETHDKRTETHSCDSISRQEAIRIVDGIDTWQAGWRGDAIESMKALPSAQPEPAIPISWIEEEIERLENRKNSFAVLDAMQLKALIKRWRGEQNENT